MHIHSTTSSIYSIYSIFTFAHFVRFWWKLMRLTGQLFFASDNWACRIRPKFTINIVVNIVRFNVHLQHALQWERIIDVLWIGMWFFRNLFALFSLVSIIRQRQSMLSSVSERSFGFARFMCVELSGILMQRGCIFDPLYLVQFTSIAIRYVTLEKASNALSLASTHMHRWGSHTCALRKKKIHSICVHHLANVCNVHGAFTERLK